mgnify:FL=1|jgi:RNA polymerase sigma-70 factor
MLPKMKKNAISEKEFGRVFSEYNRRFVEVAYRYVRDQDIAEDVVSDSFAACWEMRERLTDEDNLPAYILTAVKNKCLNHLRSKLRHLQISKKIHSVQQRLIQADIHSLTACNPDELISNEIRSILEDALGRMPDLTRKIFMGSRYEGKSYKELADELHIAYTHVNFEMRRALKILREEFKDYIPVLILLLEIGDML